MLFSENEKYKPDPSDRLYMGVLITACALNVALWAYATAQILNTLIQIQN